MLKKRGSSIEPWRALVLMIFHLVGHGLTVKNFRDKY